MLATFPQGHLYYASNDGANQGVYDISAGGDLSGITPEATGLQRNLGQIAWSSDLQTMYTTAWSNGPVFAVDADGNTSVHANVSGTLGLVWTHDDRLLVASNSPTSGAILDITDPSNISTFATTGDSQIRNMTQLPSGEILAMGTGGRIYEVSQGSSSVWATVAGVGNGGDIDFTSSGEVYASFWLSGTVGIYDVTGGGSISTSPYVTPSAGRAFGIAIDRGNGDRILAAGLTETFVLDVTGGGTFDFNEVSNNPPSSVFAYNIPTTNDMALDFSPFAGGIDISIDPADNLVVTSSTSDSDNLTLSRDNASFIIHDPDNSLFTTIPGASGSGTNTVSIPFGSIAGIAVDTLGGDDSLTIDFSGGNFPVPITYNGGGQNSTNPGDVLTLTGGSFANATYHFDNASDGSIDLTGNATITYTGLEPISSTIDATDVTLNYSTTAETITVTDAGGGQTTATSNVAAETITFNNPTGTLTINAGDVGNDVISLTSLAANFPASVAVNGQGGDDTIIGSGPIGLDNENLSLTAEAINLGSATINTGAGDQTYHGSVTLVANTTITGNDVAFRGTVDSDATPRSLDVIADGVTTFGGDVGSASALASLTTDAAGSTVLNETPPSALDAAAAGLQAYLPFDVIGTPGAGQTPDGSGNGNHGVLTGNLATGNPVSGVIGDSIDYQNDTDHVELTGYQGVTGTDVRSLSAWVRFDGTSPNQGIMYWGTNTAGQKWTFRVQDTNGVAGAIRMEVNGGFIVGQTDIRDGAWHHVAAVFEPGSASGGTEVQDIRLYVDGQLDADATNNSALGNRTINTAAADFVRIGLNESTLGWEGQIDEAAIWDRVLTPAEIAAIGTREVGIATTGDVTFNDAVNVQSNVNVAAANAFFGATVDGTQNLDVNTSGNGITTFAGAVGATAPLVNLTTNGDGSTVVSGGEVIANTNVTFGDNVTLPADLIVSAGGDVTFVGAVNDDGIGALPDLIVNAAGTTEFAGPVGNLLPIASLTTDSAGTTQLGGDSINTNGSSITFNDAVVLGSNMVITEAGAGDVTFASTVDGGFDLTVNTPGGGDTVFVGSVGDVTPLASLITDSSGATRFATPGLPAPGAATSLNYDADAESIGSGDAVWDQPGVVNLSEWDFGGSFGGAITLNAVTSAYPGIDQAYQFNNAGATNRGLNDLAGDPSDADATWEFWFRPAAGTDVDMLFETGGSGDGMSIVWDGTANQVIFTIDDGGVQRSVSGGASIIGTSEFHQLTAVYDKDNGGRDLMQLYIDGVLVDDNDSGTNLPGGEDAPDTNTNDLNDWDGGDTSSLASFGTGIAEGTPAATNYEGEIAKFRFYESALGGSQVTSAFIAVAGDSYSVTTTGDQVFGDAVEIEGDLTLTGANVSLQAIDEGDGDLNRALHVNASGVTSFNGSIGSNNDLGSLTTDFPGSTQIGAGSIDVTGSTVTFNDPVILTADLTITEAGSGDVTFRQTVDSDSGMNRALAINTLGGGNTVFGADIGSTDPLSSLTTDAAGQTVFDCYMPITAGLDFNTDATLDTDADNRWEDSIGTSGLDFELDTANGVNRVIGISSLPGISAAYDFPGGLTGNVGGAQLSVQNSGTRQSFSNAPGDWSNDDVTIEIWFRPDNLSPTPANGQILFEDGGGNGLGFFVDDNFLRLREQSGGDVVSFDISSISSEFIQAVGTFSLNGGANDRIELFVNGAFVGADANDNQNDWSGGDPAAVGTRGAANTGGIGGGQSSTESFDGQIAIFRVYHNQVLSPTEVLFNYRSVASVDISVNTTGDQAFNDTVSLATDTTFITGNDIDFGQGITGTGDVTVSPTGMASFPSATTSNYDGATNATSGIMLVNGLIDTDTDVVTIESGATLAGNGTINRPVDVLSGGTVSPGSSPGVITTGNLDLRSGSSLNIEIDGTAGAGAIGGHDQVAVNGTVTLAGSLDTTGSDIVGATLGDTFVIIDNDGTADPVSGTFDSLPNGSDVVVNGQTFRVFYDGGDGNDVILSFVPSPNDPIYVDDDFAGSINGTLIVDADGGATGNQPAVFGVNAFANVASALSSAPVSGTVIVNTGVYNEAVNLTGARTIEITGPDAAGSVTFDSLAGASGTSVALEGTSALTVGDATSTTFGGAFSGTGLLVKVGGGTLNLTAASSSTGGVSVNAGRLRLNAGGVPFNQGVFPGTQAISVAAPATLEVAGTWNIHSNNDLNVSGTLDITNGSATDSVNYINDLEVTGGTVVGNPFRTAFFNDSTLAISGGGTISAGLYLVNNVDLTGLRTATVNVPTGETGTITGAIRDLGQNGTSPNLRGTTLIKSGDGTLNLANTSASTATGLLRLDAGQLNVGGGIPGDGAWAGNVTINGGELQLNQSSPFNNSSDFTINAPGQLDMNGQTDVIGNLQGDGNVVGNSNGTGLLLDDLNGTRTFSGDIAGGGGFRVRGNVANSGTQVLSGGSYVFGTFVVGDGTVTLTGGATTTVSGTASVGTNRTGEVGGIDTGNTTGVLNIDSGSLTANHIEVGNRQANTVTATVNHSGGTVTATGNTAPDNSGIRIGHWPGSNATYNLSGTGVLNINNNRDLGIAIDGTGAFVQTGGELNTRRVNVNTRSASGNGTFTQNSGVANIGAGGIVTTGGPTAVNLGGGTLRATAAWSSSVPMALTGAVGNAIIDTNGFGVNLASVLSGSGGLDKIGTGMLTLAGVNTYLGTTNVNGGTLTVTGEIGNASPAGNVTVSAAATLEGNGIINANVVSNGTVAPGVGAATGVLATNDVDFGTGSFSVDLNGTTAGSGYDQVDVSGTIDLSGSPSLNINLGIATATGDQFTIVTNDGADLVSGAFAGLPEGFAFTLGGEEFQITYQGGDGNDIVLTALDEVNPTLSGTPMGDDFLVIRNAADNETEVYLGGNLIYSGEPASLTINGLAGDDTTTFDFDNGNFPQPITFNGQDPAIAPGDNVILQGGGTIDTVTHNFVNESEGTIEVTGSQTITYTGLEPITDNLNADNRVFNFTSAVAETITLDAGGALDNQIDSNQSETVDFNNPNGSLTINTEVAGGAGTDTVFVEGVEPTFSANLTINGGADDTVTFQTAATDVGSGSVLVNAMTINVDAAVSTDAGGTLGLNASRNITMSPTGSLTSVDGAISLAANPMGVAGNFAGISLNDADIVSDNGAITLTGQGGNAGTDNDGVLIQNNASVNSLGLATITIIGTAVAGGEEGVDVSNSALFSVDGDIDITGNAADGAGVELQGPGASPTFLEATGTATITISGTSTGAGPEAEGILIADDGTTVSAFAGNIVLVGSSANDDGIDARFGTLISTSLSDVILTTTSGSILQDGTIISGGAIDLDSIDSITFSGSGLATDTFTSLAVNDSTVTGTGFISADGQASIATTNGAIDLQAGSSVDSTADNVVLDAASSISLAGDVRALSGEVDIESATTATLTDTGTIDAGSLISIDSGAAQLIEGGIGPFVNDVSLDSGHTLTIAPTGSVTAGGTILGTSVGDTTIDGGLVSTIGNLIDFNAGGNLALSNFGSFDGLLDINLTAGGDLTLADDTTVIGNGTVTLSGGQTGGATISVIGGVAGEPILIYGGAGADSIIIDDNGGLLGDAGTVENLQTGSTVTINAGGGDDTLQLDDSGSVDADVIDIDDSVNGLHETVLIDYNDVEFLEVNAGVFEDIYNVELSPDTTFLVHGNLPPSGVQPGDTLNLFTSDGVLDYPFVFFAGNDCVQPGCSFTDAPDQPINWTSIETFSINGRVFEEGDLYVETDDTANRVIFYSTDGVGTRIRIDNVEFGPYPVQAGDRMVAFTNGGNDFVVVHGPVPPLAEFHGGTGNDYLAGNVTGDFIYGGLGNDIVLGGEGDNFLHGDDPLQPGLGGNDRIEGRAGEDIIFGGAGNDRLIGGFGNDTLDGGLANDFIFGGEGDDFSFGGGSGTGGEDDGFDVIRDHLGNDVLFAGGGVDQLFGDRGNDLLVGGSGADRINGDAQDDYLANGTASSEAMIDQALALLATGDNTLFNLNVLPALTTFRNSNGTDLSGFGTFTDDLAIDVITGGTGTDVFDSGPGDINRNVRSSEGDTEI